jgi:hypothetical protein
VQAVVAVVQLVQEQLVVQVVLEEHPVQVVHLQLMERQELMPVQALMAHFQ